MGEEDPPTWRPRARRERMQLQALVLAILCTYAYFLPRPAWNQNSRLALTRALVERRSVQIDPDHATTGDKSWREGHFYSDKAPGASLLAVPAYATFYALRRATGAPPLRAKVEPLDGIEARADRRPALDALEPGDRIVYELPHRIALWVCNLGSTIPVAGLALFALYGLARRYGGIPPPMAHRGALTVVITYALATPAFPYATSFYGHRLCGDLLILGAGLIFLPDPAVALGRRARSGAYTSGWLAGTALGWAVLCEYPAAVPVLLLTFLAGWRRGLAFVLRVVLAGALWALVLASYHTAAFGHPLSTGYDFVYLPEFAEGMAVHYGLRAPDLGVLRQLLFGSYRGLFYLAPVLLLAVWGLAVRAGGLARAARRSPTPEAIEPEPEPEGSAALLVASLIICAYYLALNAGYYMWDGGAAFGPRHCVPMLPFLALGIAPARARAPAAFVGLLALSVALMLLGAAAGPEAPGHGDPIWAYAWPTTVQGGLGPGAHLQHAGHLMGLRGLWSLAPLALLWVALRPWRPPDPLA